MHITVKTSTIIPCFPHNYLHKACKMVINFFITAFAESKKQHNNITHIHTKKEQANRFIIAYFEPSLYGKQTIFRQLALWVTDSLCTVQTFYLSFRILPIDNILSKYSKRMYSLFWKLRTQTFHTHLEQMEFIFST